MPKAVTYRTEDEAAEVLKRLGYTKVKPLFAGSEPDWWQSPHNEQRADIKSDDARSYFWIEYRSNGYKFTANS